jgi:spore coat protein JB
LDFIATDLHLYMNTHRDDREALEVFNDVAARAADARATYEARFGPIVGFRTQGSAGWPWGDSPWPWQESYNFDFTNLGHTTASAESGEENL